MTTRYLGSNQVITVETADDTYTVVNYVTQTDLDDGTPDKQTFIGGDWNQVGHGLKTYRIESMFELDATATTGNWAVARSAQTRSGTAPAGVRFYPAGTASGERYFEMDAVVEVHDEGMAKDGKGMFRLIAEPHLAGTAEPDWYTA